MDKKFKPFEKKYGGFESIFDLERDISEWLEHDSNLPGEFTGTLKVKITYEPADED